MIVLIHTIAHAECMEFNRPARVDAELTYRASSTESAHLTTRRFGQHLEVAIAGDWEGGTETLVMEFGPNGPERGWTGRTLNGALALRAVSPGLIVRRMEKKGLYLGDLVELLAPDLRKGLWQRDSIVALSPEGVGGCRNKYRCDGEPVAASISWCADADEPRVVAVTYQKQGDLVVPTQFKWGAASVELTGLVYSDEAGPSLLPTGASQGEK